MASEQVVNALLRLGKRGKDRVTGYSGVITSVAFDLYGCVQLALTPLAKQDADEIKSGHWFDANRIEITQQEPVMSQPDFVRVIGPAEKPRMTQLPPL